MKAKVIKRFKDKYTREQYIPGDTFVSDEAARIEDLLNRRLIEPVETAIDYTALTKKEIAAILDKQGIEYSIKSKKDELISLLGGE